MPSASVLRSSEIFNPDDHKARARRRQAACSRAPFVPIDLY